MQIPRRYLASAVALASVAATLSGCGKASLVATTLPPDHPDSPPVNPDSPDDPPSPDDPSSSTDSTAEPTTSTAEPTTSTAKPTDPPSCDDVPPDAPLSKPASPLEWNGVAWPAMCFDKTEAHFFGIGDWGGDHGGGHTWDNPDKCEARGGRIGGDDGPDEYAQLYVAREMKTLARSADPDFVLNAGDNFYPSGVGDLGSCGEQQANLPADQIWRDRFESVYSGPGLDGKPWLSVLGNHDYGGFSYETAWDAQIFHTWDSNNIWRMPGQFWSQRVQYSGFSVEIYMLESNHLDALPPGVNPGSNICQDKVGNNPDCWGLNVDSCQKHFNDAWTNSLVMLEDRLSKTDADWKIINTHYPGPNIAGDPRIQDLNNRYGIDLLFTGHTHWQKHGEDFGIPWIVSGGGGGVSADCLPDINGDDEAYGFVDFTITKDSLKFDLRSWGGMDPSPDGFIRSSRTLSKRSTNASLAGQVAFV